MDARNSGVHRALALLYLSTQRASQAEPHFKALASEPMTADTLATKTGCDPRYILEWLSAQAASGYAEYDPATQKFTHGFASAQELASQIDANNRVPLCEAHFVKGGIALQSGVIDQDVDRSEMRDGLGEHLPDLFLLAHVGAYHHGITATGSNLIGNALGFVRVCDVVDRHIRARCAEGESAGFADAGTRTGDECFLVFEGLLRIYWGRRHKFQTK